MKKLFSVLLTFTLLISAIPLGSFKVNAADTVYTDGYLKYVVVDNRAIIVEADTTISGDVILPDTLGGYEVISINTYAFYLCSMLESITIPDGVTTINGGAFYLCSSLKSVVIPDSVTTIGNYAFYDCSDLENITMGNGVVSIGDNAFESCSALRSITIPASVTSIGTNAFLGCALAEYNVDKNNLNYCSKDGVLFNKDATILIKYPNRKSNLPYVIPDGVITIGSSAFASYPGTSITIPDSVTCIESSAFNNSSLTEIIIGNGVKDIGSNAFSRCLKLTSVILSDSVVNIDKYAFWFCEKLTNVKFGNNVECIGNNAFELCSSLAEISLPDSIISIGGSAFYKTAYYENNDNWDNTVLYIGKHLIKAKTNLSGEYIVKDGTLTIAHSAFYLCKNLTGLTMPNSVVSIDYGAFYDCTNLSNLTISDNIVNISDYAFYNTAYYLDKNNWDNGVFYIGKHLIEADAGITGDYSIKSGTLYVGPKAFCDCTKLTGITIPNSVVSIGKEAFRYCNNLESVNISDISAWCKIDFPDTHSNPLNHAEKLYLNGEIISGEIVLSDDVTVIPDYTFYKSEITSISLPDGLVSIGHMAFNYCHDLASIDLPDSVTDIGYYAFANCSSIVSINIPDNVTTISRRAFSECNMLKEVTIGKGVKKIGERAFDLCYNLVRIEIAGRVEIIDECAFRCCESLTDIMIPDSVVTINERAFSICYSLENVWYTGSEKDKAEIAIESGNEILSDVTWHYNCCEEGKHKYENTCDVACNICGWTRTVNHMFKYIAEIPATCTQDGVSAHEKCTVCGMIIKNDYEVTAQDLVISKLKHTLIAIEGIAATTESDGIMAHYKCSDCKNLFMDNLGTIPVKEEDIVIEKLPPYTPGDLNNDGNVNNKDLGLLMQSLNNWNITISVYAADVNADSNINNKDYGLLMQYINKWDVELKR